MYSLAVILSKMEDTNTEQILSSLMPVERSFSKGWSKGNDRMALRILVALIQSFIAFATAPLTVAADGKGANSPYTAAIAKYIGEPGKNILKFFDCIDRSKATEPKTNTLNNYSLDNEFYFIATNFPTRTKTDGISGCGGLHFIMIKTNWKLSRWSKI
jgi:hypothetical protein